MFNNFLLLLTAAIWGFAFVAQRVGMEYLGPFLFNGVRFALGGLSLLPILFTTNYKGLALTSPSLKTGMFAGFLLFGGASLQQIGIQYTTAGKAGFITGLYVVLVPILGSFLGTQSGKYRWIGAISTTLGLYFLSVNTEFTVNKGDFLVFISAFFFACHVLYLAKVSPQMNPILLSILQYMVVSICSIVLALLSEKIQIKVLLSAWLPILYGGIFSVGIAYSLQVIAQKKAHPTHAAILLSMEGFFAAVGGALLLGERFTFRETLGAFLMLSGMLISQWNPTEKRRGNA
ncbi:MAG: DMT family transporter [Spirochaetes bacterium]|nr:DMT family transporter [Spirochaetota bacterium]